MNELDKWDKTRKKIWAEVIGDTKPEDVTPAQLLDVIDRVASAAHHSFAVLEGRIAAMEPKKESE